MFVLAWLAFFMRSGKKSGTLSDHELISAYKENGDPNPIGELFERYSLQIYGICRKYLDDEDERRDAAMEVFEYLLTELLKYDIEKFPQWLGRATRNFCLMRLRKRATQQGREKEYKNSEVEFMESGPEAHHPVEDDPEMSLKELESALLELQPGQRQCIELFYLQGKSYQEVSVLTGLSFMQVKSFIQNGKRNLRIRLEGRI